ncbi:MAG: hypothetical protein RL518_65 [Pseudomonadota bacterium]|jgi:hypothetical protein
MKVERIQLSLTSETKQISRFLNARREDASGDLTKDDHNPHNHSSMREEEQRTETATLQALIASEASSKRLLDIMA